ncbi:unnamed protein product [Euphydryas editha]|uniref:Uncharacterized protein n=1 Tax=Euphydryas editha TaxID=104508 RepID=A0AAU9UYJ3_EUPED|nr:unnamed protein product [Euphydryas editha]
MAGRFSDSMRSDASGICPGGEDMQAIDVPRDSCQPLVRDEPENATGVHKNLKCCSCAMLLIRHKEMILFLMG